MEMSLLDFKKNILLKDYTTYKIGGPAKYFFVAKSEEDLISAIKLAKKEKLPIFILGGGSNLLVSDKGFPGLVMKIDILGANLKKNKLIVGAGEILTRLAYLTADNELSGLEWAAGIPGATVGGSIYGHAQAFGTKMSDIIESVQVIDLKSLELKNFSLKQCQFSLKNSIFKKNRSLVIISAVLKFKKSNKDQVRNKIREFLDYRKNRHPMNFPSPGSTFVNPEVIIKDKKLLEKFPELNEFNKKGTIAAGYLIASVGLSGRKIGGAQISEKHCNFIVNLGGATAKCVVGLINLARRRVKKNFNIDLETEVQFVGF